MTENEFPQLPPTATDDVAESSPADAKAARSLRKKAASRLGWKLVGQDTAEIKVEREFQFGPRTVIVRGRVTVDVPAEISESAGLAAITPLVDPAVAKFQFSLERAAPKILRRPDDVSGRHIFEHPSFFTALENAQRRVIQLYQELENQRLDETVEADLGLRFYLDGLTHADRTFTYFVGPTNSGKTHAALEFLRAARSGMYLAPLRLLALEVHERLNDLGVLTSLVTGEERVLMPGSEHVSSTVEMVDLMREYDVAVIDEAQMLQDEQRGWAWTLAIAGARAKSIVMCGSEDGLLAAQKLIEKLGATIDVRRFERKNPLKVIEPVPLAHVKPGDAVVAFSRNAVVELQTQIGRTGKSTAAIYGSLSPVVRRKEAERFRNGVADILVATDAIGLGLNLPIKRLIFAEVEKFDGVNTRRLTPPEIRQIAGRAGRFGMHEEGQVSAFDYRSVKFLRESLDKFLLPADDQPIWISPTDEHLRRLAKILNTDRMSRLLQFFQTRVLREEMSDLRIADLSGMIEVALALEISDGFVRLPLEIRSTYCRAPVTTRGNSLAILARWGERHALDNQVDGMELSSAAGARDRLLLAEDRSRLATLYVWLAQRFPNVYTNSATVVELREEIDIDIQRALSQHGAHAKKSGRGGAKPGGKPGAKPNFSKRKGPPKFDKRRLGK